MKKHFILIILISILFAFNLQSQNLCNFTPPVPCPQGSLGPYCFTMTWNGCDVAIFYCAIISNNTATVSFLAFNSSQACWNAINLAFSNQMFIELMTNLMIQDLFDNHPSVFPPCNSGTGNTSGYLVFQRGLPFCVKGVNDPINQIIWRVPCDEPSSYCWAYYYACYDSTTNKVILTYDHSEMPAGSNCPFYDPNDPYWSTPPWEEFWESPCYNLGSCVQ